MSDFAAVRIHSKTTSIFSSRPIISRKRWTAGERSSWLTVARRSRKWSRRSRTASLSGLGEAYRAWPLGAAARLRQAEPASSRMQFSTSSRIRPNVCINASRSNDSSGRAAEKRRIAARSGD
jgi:hypothetical protein